MTPKLPLIVVQGANYDAVMLFDGNIRELVRVNADRECAEWIARACNTHDKLVADLKSAVKMLANFAGEDACVAKRLDEMEQTLADAGGGN